MPIPNTYVKINKIDHNGVNNDIALGQATKLKIKYTTEPNYLTIGNILTKTEYPTYWLYKVQSLGSNTADNYIKDYSVSASNVTSTPFPPYPGNPITNFISVVNPSGFWDNTTGLYTTPATSNVALILSASITTSGSDIGGGTSLRIRSSIQGVIASKNIIAGSNVITSLTSSYYPLGGDQLSFNISTFGGDITLKSGSFLITQSIAPTASVSCSVIIEPYITEPNFYNSDDNALLNSVNEQRESTFALDVDYGYGITPINFGLLVSGSGTSATVPDSNYTSKKSTILKYDGSKSTSQLLNKWTQGDTEGYGKLPSIESAVTDGVSLTVTVNPQIAIDNLSGNERYWTFVHYFYKNSEIIFTSLEEIVTAPGNSGAYYTLTSPTFTLPAGTFNSGDNISYYIKVISDGDPYNYLLQFLNTQYLHNL
jgi:hypothetical protein